MANLNYWNHNVAYHNWILKHVQKQDTVLDVGCGDGLLVSKLAPLSKKVIGVDSHFPSIIKAKEHISQFQNATVINVSFEDFKFEEDLIDTVIFVASIHHMDMAEAIEKAKKLLSPHGKIIIVGIAKPIGILDHIIELLRVIPAKIGSIINNEKVSEQIGVPTVPAEMSYKQIKEISRKHLPDAEISRGLYYRYLLFWRQG